MVHDTGLKSGWIWVVATAVVATALLLGSLLGSPGALAAEIELEGTQRFGFVFGEGPFEEFSIKAETRQGPADRYKLGLGLKARLPGSGPVPPDALGASIWLEDRGNSPAGESPGQALLTWFVGERHRFLEGAFKLVDGGVRTPGSPGLSLSLDADAARTVLLWVKDVPAQGGSGDLWALGIRYPQSAQRDGGAGLRLKLATQAPPGPPDSGALSARALALETFGPLGDNGQFEAGLAHAGAVGGGASTTLVRNLAGYLGVRVGGPEWVLQLEALKTGAEFRFAPGGDSLFPPGKSSLEIAVQSKVGKEVSRAGVSFSRREGAGAASPHENREVFFERRLQGSYGFGVTWEEDMTGGPRDRSSQMIFGIETTGPGESAGIKLRTGETPSVTAKFQARSSPDELLGLSFDTRQEILRVESRHVIRDGLGLRAIWKYRLRPASHWYFAEISQPHGAGRWSLAWGTPDGGRLDVGWNSPPRLQIAYEENF
ncbi:MAG: hypothetical protein HYY08_04445 [Firmicutes bacterium]|nr:hypothetical protein [Bacillota bacterium]